jgi:hypothetical protein
VVLDQVLEHLDLRVELAVREGGGPLELGDERLHEGVLLVRFLDRALGLLVLTRALLDRRVEELLLDGGVDVEFLADLLDDLCFCPPESDSLADSNDSNRPSTLWWSDFSRSITFIGLSSCSVRGSRNERACGSQQGVCRGGGDPRHRAAVAA